MAQMCMAAAAEAGALSPQLGLHREVLVGAGPGWSREEGEGPGAGEEGQQDR